MGPVSWTYPAELVTHPRCINAFDETDFHLSVVLFEGSWEGSIFGDRDKLAL